MLIEFCNRCHILTACYPQFDGGLKVTSLVVTGIFALASRTGNAPAITGVNWDVDLCRSIPCGCPYGFSVFQAQATKFGNYFLSSKYTTAVDNLSFMLAAANALATNKVSKAHNEYKVHTAISIIDPSFSLSLSLSLSLSPPPIPLSVCCTQFRTTLKQPANLSIQ